MTVTDLDRQQWMPRCELGIDHKILGRDMGKPLSDIEPKVGSAAI